MNEREYIEHYKGRLRALLPYVRHLETCGYVRTSAPPCTCGAAVIAAIVQAEVEEPHPGSPLQRKCDETDPATSSAQAGKNLR